jgi:alpha-galactosidase
MFQPLRKSIVFSLLVMFSWFQGWVLGQQQPLPLKVVRTSRTSNGFDSPPRGWNSFGLQANPGINPSFAFDQNGVIEQADALLKVIPADLLAAHDYYISLDSGWSIGDHGDEHGRITYETSNFDIPALASYLHSKGLKLGVYILPGAFCKDSNKTIDGTYIPIEATLTGNNNGFSRCDFDFSKDGVQEWHDGVVGLFASWYLYPAFPCRAVLIKTCRGVDLIKLDYVTPGSPSNGGNLPPDNSGEVIAYHKAIAASGRRMRLNISWKLERNETYFKIWSSNADSMRTDQDINNSNEDTFIEWATVQRAIENYRDFISRVVNATTEPVTTIYPDMDSLFVGNGEAITGVTDSMRQTIATHWIGAGANLITGSDMTKIDELGVRLLTDKNAMEVADSTAKYPMQPRNPGTGRNDSKQLQAWIAGPDDSGNAVVVLVNYGPDEGQGGFGTKIEGKQLVKATFSDLGISGKFGVKNVWTGEDMGTMDNEVSATLDAGESLLLKLART